MVKTRRTLTIAAAALAAGTYFDVPASRAAYSGDAPWCVVTTGDDTHWNCRFGTAEECMRAIAAGIRGSCNVNPYHRRDLARPNR